MAIGRFQQSVRADDIRVDERSRTADRTVYMAFCSEVDNPGWVVLYEDGFHRFLVADIRSHEGITIVVSDRFQRFEVRRICKPVNVDDRHIWHVYQRTAYGRADKTCATGDENA